ncbi:hypothetical protein ACERII_06760 [Evansella sp. AB-rgal1]|uniref:hypothetical protein n=1 Tax=Evansella sp. AB-rgal1 TaxID=3242696 RepID=UPI00359EBF93
MIEKDQTNTNDHEIDIFFKVMLDKPKVEADRTWLYSLKRFFQYITLHTNDNISFTVESINSYIQYLQEKGKSETYIKKNVYVIYTFAHYKQMNIIKEKISIKIEDKIDVSMVEEEDDIYHTEELLYERIKETTNNLILSRKPEIYELHNNSYSDLRVKWQDYLLFRLVLETGIDIDDLTSVSMEDIYEDRVTINDRDIPILGSIAKLLHQYIGFRKQFDKATFTQLVMFHMGIRSSSISELYADKNYKYFLEKDLSEKIAEIESHLMQQVSIEEKIQEIEMLNEDTHNDKVEVLEEELDGIAEKIGNMKAILVFERKLNEYNFNNALFVTERYTKMDQSDILNGLIRESFPLHKLQNSCIEKWNSEGIKIKQIEKVLGKKGTLFAKPNRASDLEEYRKMVSSSYSFHDRDFSNPS